MSRQLLSGTLLAVGSALLFGAAAPLVQRLAGSSEGAGPFVTAALLYGGVAVLGLATIALRGGHHRETEAPLRLVHAPRVVAIAVIGAALAPALLAFGLARASGVAGSLLLNLEAVFTVALGARVHREHVGRQVALAVMVTTAGSALLIAPHDGASQLVGLLAIAGATLAWALDNTLARPLADLDPAAVVAWKGAIGALLSATVAFVRGEALPRGADRAVGLVVVGVVGWGLSLRIYVEAQRRLGAGRTASIFAVAPFAGALVSALFGEPLGGARTVIAAALLALGVALHATEHHAHDHEHASVEHEHAHCHDDEHHDHAHDEMPERQHSHSHRHAARRHRHPHAPDLHHDHSHS